MDNSRNRISLLTLVPFYKRLISYMSHHDRSRFVNEYKELLVCAKSCGYDMVDISNMELDLVGIEGMKTLLSDNHLKVGAFLIADQFADSSASSDRIQKTRELICQVQELGMHYIMLVPQAHPGIEMLSADEIQAALCTHFQPVSDYCASLGLQAMVEDTPDLRLHLCSSVDILNVLKLCPNLGMVFDSANMLVSGENPVSYYHSVKEHIVYWHVKDCAVVDPSTPNADLSADGQYRKMIMLGCGDVDIKQLMQLSSADGYDGIYTVEYGNDGIHDETYCLQYCYSYLKDLL